MKKILVTGAGGFVGTGLLPRLAVAGYPVRVAARMTNNVSADDVAIITDIGPTTDWTSALNGIDTVVHLAARAHVIDARPGESLGVYRHVNVEGTKRLAEQARAAGVRRFILMSSVKAAAETTSQRPLVETDAPVPRTSYGISKWEAEQALAEAAAQGTNGAMETVILRPPLVYGPGVAANFLTLLRLVDSGLPLPLGAVANRRSLVARDNLVDAIAVAIEAPGVVGGTYYVSDGPALSTPALVRALGTALGRSAKLLPIPTALLRPLIRFVLNADSAESLLGSLEIDDAAFRAAANWRPPVGPEKAFRDTALAYRNA